MLQLQMRCLPHGQMCTYVILRENFYYVNSKKMPAKADAPAMQHFQVAQEVLHACEIAIARGKTVAPKGIRSRLRCLSERSLPIELLLRAGRPSILTFSVWAGLLLLLTVVAYGFLKPTGWILDKDFDVYFQVSATFLTLCFVLSRPSVHGFPDWRASDFQNAKQLCSVLVKVQEADIEAVKYFVDHAIACTRRRITALWWLTGVIWAIATYFAQKGLETKDGSMLGFALVPIIFAAFGTGLVASYARSIDHVHGIARALLFDRRSTQKKLMNMRELRGRRREHGSRT